MKKLVSLALVLALALGMGMGALAETEEDNGFIDFEPMVAGLLDYSDTEWFSTGLNRALLTVFLILDVSESEEALKLGLDADLLSTIMVNDTFVGNCNYMLFVGGHTDEGILVIQYMPLLGRASFLWSEMDYASSATVELLLDGTCSGEVRKNSSSDITACIDLVNKALND